MPSQPEEKPSEDIRTALQLLNGGWMSSPLGGTVYFGMEPNDMQALRARLESALGKITDLEGLAIGRREHELAIMLDRAEYIAREFPPLDYPVVEDRALRGQQVDEDGK